MYLLYINGKPIDSSKYVFSNIAVNNSGNYIYATIENQENNTGKNNYMFFIHSQDTILGPVSTIKDNDLKDNGSYYYLGEENGHNYIAVNNRIFKNIESISHITIIDWNSFLFLFRENGSNKINVNGKIYNHDFEDVFRPVLDKDGNFAFYGLKDYYIYKYLNGIKLKEPITNYGVRPVPLYISTSGVSLHYFKTDDSIYLYQDNEMVFQAISKNKKFKVFPSKEMFYGDYGNNRYFNRNSLNYIEYDSSAYMVLNGHISKPMIPIYFPSDKNRIGKIIAGGFNDSGFYIIQCIGDSKFMININNVIYQVISNVDEIVYDDYFFNKSELIFYGIRDNSYCQFRIKL